MATHKAAPLDGGLIARKGLAAPASAPTTSAATKATIAVTVCLDPQLYLRLKSPRVSCRPCKTNEEMIVQAIEEYLLSRGGDTMRDEEMED